jgi:hypothetical protein
MQSSVFLNKPSSSLLWIQMIVLSALKMDFLLLCLYITMSSDAKKINIGKCGWQW